MSDTLRQRLQRGERVTAGGLAAEAPTERVMAAVRRRRAARSGAIGGLAVVMLVAGAFSVSALVNRNPVEPVSTVTPSATASPSASPTATPTATSTPTATAEPADAPIAWVISAHRDDGSAIAIPVTLDGQALDPIEIGASGARAFRVDDRGIWVYQPTAECFEYCAEGIWSVIDPVTKRTTVLATGKPEPGGAQVVDGVAYSTNGCCGSSKTWRLDGVPMPATPTSPARIDETRFSPDGTWAMMRTTTDGDDGSQTGHVYLVPAGATPTEADELKGLPDGKNGYVSVDWLDDSTLLVASHVLDDQNSEWAVTELLVVDAETKSVTPVPMLMPTDWVWVAAPGVLAYRPDVPAGESLSYNDPRAFTYATISGEVIGTGPSVTFAEPNMASGARAGLWVDDEYDDQVYSNDDGINRLWRIVSVSLFDVTTGVATPVSGFPADATWSDGAVASSP